MLIDLRETRLQRSMADVLHILGRGEYATDITEKLSRTFGQPSSALEAAEKDIADVAHCDENAAFALSMALPLARYMLEEDACAISAVTNMDQARQKLLPHYLGTHYECGQMLCLDRHGNFISCVPLRMGTVDEAPFYLRIILEEALISGGECFIVAHNHPGGTRHPSAEDCSSTRNIAQSLSKLEMVLIDHIIIADGDAVSIRASGAVDSSFWAKYAPLPESFKNWPL